MQTVKQGVKYGIVFMTAVMALTGLLVLSALLPRSAIASNVRESAEYLCEGELFGTLADGVEGSKIDRYADSILLAIAYQYDSGHPLTSVMRSAYYTTELWNENENLLAAVTNGYEPNQQYLRYWHGSNVIVRPLLQFFCIQEIYVLNAVLLAVLAVILLVLLLKNRAFLPAGGMAAGLVLTAVWYVPFSLEYTWTYFLMLFFAILGFLLARREKWSCLGYLFLLDGIVTNFVDFLTTETLTLLVPLLLILWADRQQHPEKPPRRLFGNAVRAVVAWGCGYVGMWMMKWGMAALVLKKNVLPDVLGHIEERAGAGLGSGRLRYGVATVLRNIRCLFPLEYGTTAVIIGLAVCFFIVYYGYVYRKQQLCGSCILLYALLGAVPYFRYLVLLNHSYLHFFFTYRAQLATVLALALLMEELTERRGLLCRWQKKKALR